MNRPARNSRPDIQGEVERMARRGTVAIERIAATIYEGRRPPKDPTNNVRIILCKLRRQGVPVHIHQCHVTIGPRPTPFPLDAGKLSFLSDVPFCGLDLEVLRCLREFRGIPLTPRDIADEIGFTAYPSNLVKVMRRIVAKGVAINRVGTGYCLARAGQAGNRREEQLSAEVRPC